MIKGQKQRVYIGLAIGFAYFIIYLIYLANTATPNIFVDSIRALPHGDKLGHLVLASILTLLVNLAIGNASLCRFRLGPITILTGTTIVAILIVAEEFAQHFIPTRTFNVLDLLSDLTGIIIGNSAALWWLHGTSQEDAFKKN